MPNVSTFTEFVNALTSINTGDVINITADLDFNTWLPSAGLTFPLHCPSDSHQVENVVINGNGHTIYNLTNSYSGGGNNGTFAFHVLTGKECIQINNLNFLNCSCMKEDKPVFTVNVDQSTNYPSIGIYDSTIQGAFAYSPFFRNFWCVRCMITIQSNTGTFVTTADNTNPVYKQCWIYLNNISKTSTRSVLPLLEQCYVKGVINYAALSAAGQLNIARCKNSCINVTADVTGFSFSVPLSTIIRQQGEEISIVNTDKLQGTTASTDARLIAVTDEQMRDANYLFNIGFDIIPS